MNIRLSFISKSEEYPLKMTPFAHFRFWRFIRWGNEYPLCNTSFPILMKQPLKMTRLFIFVSEEWPLRKWQDIALHIIGGYLANSQIDSYE